MLFHLESRHDKHDRIQMTRKRYPYLCYLMMMRCQLHLFPHLSYEEAGADFAESVQKLGRKNLSLINFIFIQNYAIQSILQFIYAEKEMHQTHYCGANELKF